MSKIPFTNLLWLLLVLLLISFQVGHSTLDSAPNPILHTFSNSWMISSQQRPLTAIRIDSNGDTFITQVAKQQLANDLRLPLRDLRFVDPSYPSQIQATFIARPDAILFSIEYIKVILRKDEAFIFSPNDTDVQKFIPLLQQHIQHWRAHLTNASEVISQSSPNTLHIEDRSSLNINSFELIVMETALNLVCTSLLLKVRTLEPVMASALADLRAESRGLDVIQTQADELLPLKNILDELRKRVKEIKRAITVVLDSDEDMTMMCLSAVPASTSFTPNLSNNPDIISHEDEEGLDGKLSGRKLSVSSLRYLKQSTTYPARLSISEAEFMAVEILFENFLHETEWIAAEVDDLLDEITNTEENVVLQLDLLRNRILKFELNLSIFSFVVTCGALVTGLFGMNLFNHFETNGFMFYAVTTILMVSMAAMYQSFNRYARTQKLF